MRKTLKHKRKARNKAGVRENRVTIISDYFKTRPVQGHATLFYIQRPEWPIYD